MLRVLGCSPNAEAFAGWIRGNKETISCQKYWGPLGGWQTQVSMSSRLWWDTCKENSGSSKVEKATRAWFGWVSFNSDMDFMHWHSLTHSRLSFQHPWRGHGGWDQPLTELSFPPLLSYPSIFLLLIPAGWLWMSHLFPMGASSDWTPYPSLPLEVIRIGTVSLFPQGELMMGSY